MPDDQDPIDGDPIERDPIEADTPDELPAEGGPDTEVLTPEPPAGTPGDGADEPAAGAPDAAILAELSGIVGADAERLYGFGTTAGETVAVGIESVVANRGEFRAVSARNAEFSELESEFAGSDHLSVEIRVALDEAEIYSIVAIAALEELGTLFAIDTSPEQMADEEFASGQIEVISSGLRELLDLSGLMLFSDDLAGAEATLGEARVSAIEETVAALTDASGEPMGLRIEFTLALPEEQLVRVVVAAPAGLVARLASLAPSGDAAAEDELGLPEQVSTIGDAPSAPHPETPSRPALDFDEDLAVHPVRFPTLGPGEPGLEAPSSLDLIMDVSLRVTVELGRSTMTVEEVLALGPGLGRRAEQARRRASRHPDQRPRDRARRGGRRR